MKFSVDSNGGRPQNTAESSGPDGFTLHFADGRGSLFARELRINDAVVVNEIELAIAQISFPFDMSEGVGGLMHYRHSLERMSVTVFADGLQNVLEERMKADPRFRPWTLSFVEGGLSFGYVDLLLHEGAVEARRALCLRLIPTLSEGRFEVLIDVPIPFGPVEGNLVSAAMSALKTVFGVRPSGLIARLENLPRDILLHVLPKRGWRLPDDEGIQLSDFQLFEDRISFRYEHRDSISRADIPAPSIEDGEVKLETGEPELYKTAPPEQLKTAPPGRLDIAKLREELHTLKEVDRLILQNRPDEARRALAALIDRAPDNPSVIARSAILDATDRKLWKNSLHRTMLAAKRVHNRRDLTASCLHGFANSNDKEAEAEILRHLLDSGQGPQQLAAGIRLGWLLMSSDLKQAVSIFERTASLYRDDRTALLALMEAAAKNRDLERVRRLLPRFIAGYTASEDRALAHATVGEVMLTLGDVDTALSHFETACAVDPKNEKAAFGLAETLVRLKDYSRAAERLEVLASTLKTAGDLSGSATASARLADIWMEKDEPSLAIQRLSESIALDPGKPERRLALAKAAVKTANIGRAVKELEIAVRQAEAADDRRLFAESLTLLAGLYLYELDEPEAARAAARRGLSAKEPVRALEEILRRALDRRTAFEDGTRSPFGTPGEVLELAWDFLRVRDEKAAIRTLESGIAFFPESVEIEDKLIEYTRQTKDVDRLFKALTSRLETVVSPRRRAEMEIELGNLCLTQKNDAAAAACWFKSALDKVPLEAAESGLEAAISKLKEISSTVSFGPFQKDGGPLNLPPLDDESARAEQYLARLVGADLAEHLSRRQSAIDPERLRRAAALFLSEGMTERAKSVLETLYRETDAIDDLFLLVNVLKQLREYEVLIGMLEERRNEDPRVDERLKEELSAYTRMMRGFSVSPLDSVSEDPLDPERTTPRTDGMSLPMDTDPPMPDLTEDEESLNEKLSFAFNQLRLK